MHGMLGANLHYYIVPLCIFVNEMDSSTSKIYGVKLMRQNDAVIA